MICTCIAHKTLEQIWGILDDPFVELAEIRLDLCEQLSPQDITDLFETCEKPLIAKGPYKKVALAAKAGARYIDIPLDAPSNISQSSRKLSRETGAELIRSYHNFQETPDLDYLQQIALRALRYGASIVKIVTTARSGEDLVKISDLYKNFGDPAHLVAFAMSGPQDPLPDNNSRLDCLRLGAPFTYAAYDEPVAPGQSNYIDVHKAVYGGHNGFFRTDLSVPASKSFAQRAIICAALAQGTSHLRGYTPCEDSEAAIALAKALGAVVRRNKTTLTITGGAPDYRRNLKEINTGESGLLTRLLIPVLSVINGCPFTVNGTKTLLNRPLSGASDIMAAFGVILKSLSPAQDKEIRVPLTVKGPLIAGVADIPGSGGSQLISGLMMALPLCDRPSKVYVGEPKSLPYMFMTEDILRKFSVTMNTELEGNAQMLEMQDWTYCSGINFNIKGGQKYVAADVDIEGDWSAGANYLVAGAVFGAAEVSGLDTSSIQADITILDILTDAGAAVSYDDTVVSVHKAPLVGILVNLDNAPDLFPITAVLSAFCQGESRLSGVSRLRAKESDRAAGIVQMLTRMGVPARIEGDELVVSGESYACRCLRGHLLRGGSFSCNGDHRMAMALRIAAIGADSPVEIDNPQCVGKSFPEFFESMD